MPGMGEAHVGVRRRGPDHVVVPGGERAPREVQQLMTAVHEVRGDGGAAVEAGQFEERVLIRRLRGRTDGAPGR
ncbi:hypothetical protein STRTUCAR8_05244 [Streptomyces turgidiscabies Car8]|uniref:Uncharacterized protein n=1 Tax=Streptomyces turgidiscabies (strain Car8) TaxID=698760 RepID=L7FFA2_STRT8|nr:hypothetical protein STRTUCAR8_05244 [Streptomyces turgidiscabies Car8]